MVHSSRVGTVSRPRPTRRHSQGTASNTSPTTFHRPGKIKSGRVGANHQISWSASHAASRRTPVHTRRIHDTPQALTKG